MQTKWAYTVFGCNSVAYSVVNAGPKCLLGHEEKNLLTSLQLERGQWGGPCLVEIFLEVEVWHHLGGHDIRRTQRNLGQVDSANLSQSAWQWLLHCKIAPVAQSMWGLYLLSQDDRLIRCIHDMKGDEFQMMTWHVLTGRSTQPSRVVAGMGLAKISLPVPSWVWRENCWKFRTDAVCVCPFQY